jgi:probable rRNA maturation factor
MNDDPDSSHLQVEVRIEDPAWLATIPKAEALCRQAADAAAGCAGLCPEDGEVTIVLADDGLLRRLNRQFRGLDKPTNVLSFSLDEPDSRAAPDLPRLLGDVVLARETVLREAAEQGKAPADHLRHLVVHGLLHLLGYDHEEAAQAERMEAAEVAILAGLGVADPYREQPAVAGGTAGR